MHLWRPDEASMEPNPIWNDGIGHFGHLSPAGIDSYIPGDSIVWPELNIRPLDSRMWPFGRGKYHNN